MTQTMREPTPHFNSLLEVFNFRSKRELVRHSKNLVVHQQDLVALILVARKNALGPYCYANHFAETTPDHLHTNEAERDAFAANDVGTFRTKEAQKFVSKTFQLFRERRSLAAHFFYTPDHQYWHIFYFDNRDTSESNNHWKHGPHIHYVSDFWTELSLGETWQQINRGEMDFPNKLHLRYKSSTQSP